MGDTYTKFVLTIIAVALCVLVVQNVTARSNAQDAQLQRVQICDEGNCLNLAPLRKRTSRGERFLGIALPVYVDSDAR
jgi:hypothetical protein